MQQDFFEGECQTGEEVVLYAYDVSYVKQYEEVSLWELLKGELLREGSSSDGRKVIVQDQKKQFDTIIDFEFENKPRSVFATFLRYSEEVEYDNLEKDLLSKNKTNIYTLKRHTNKEDEGQAKSHFHAMLGDRFIVISGKPRGAENKLQKYLCALFSLQNIQITPHINTETLNSLQNVRQVIFSDAFLMKYNKKEFQNQKKSLGLSLFKEALSVENDDVDETFSAEYTLSLKKKSHGFVKQFLSATLKSLSDLEGVTFILDSKKAPSISGKEIPYFSLVRVEQNSKGDLDIDLLRKKMHKFLKELEDESAGH